MRNLLFGAALALAALTGCSKSDGSKAAPAEKAEPTFPKMTVDQVEQAIAAKSVTPVDCNSDRTRKKLGVLPGAISVTDEDTYAASELPADKTTHLVFYCADPGWQASHSGAVRAKSFGYTNITLMPDGIHGWVKAGKKTQPAG